MPEDAVRYPRYWFPPAIISHAVWLYYRFALSFRDVEDVLAQRGITVSYETIRHWSETFGLAYARRLRHRAGPVGDTWHLDELFVTICGQRQYLWRAVDQDGEVIDILLKPRRDRHAAARFFRRLLKRSARVPWRLVTDRLGSYRAAHRVVMPSVVHDTTRYANNRAEVSHQPTRRRERHMRRFKSAAQAQRFLAVHDVVRNLFSVGRHQLRAAQQRLLRSRAFGTWDAVAAA
jgi:putative transposase